MKYVIKRVLIGVLLFLIIGFLKNQKVFAYSNYYYLELQKCNDLGGTAMCNNTPVRTPFESTFILPKNSIVKNLLQDYYNLNLVNDSSQTRYYQFKKGYESQFVPTDTTSCPNINDDSYTHYKTADYFNAKNYRIIACEYVDSQNNSHDCLENIYTDDSNLLHYRNFVNDDNWANIYGSKGYWSAVGEWVNVNGFNYIKTYYFALTPGMDIKSMSIKYGGFGSYIGNINNLYSGREVNNWSSYYLDYPLINNCTFSASQSIEFTRTSWYEDIGFDFNNYQTNVPLVTESYLAPIDSNQLSEDIAELEGQEELQKDLALQDRLIGYDEQNIESESDDTIEHVSESINDGLDNAPTLFYDFLALPVNLLTENSNYDIYDDIHGSGALQCQSYSSEYLTQGAYNTISGTIILTVPFTHQNLKLDCFNANVLSPYNKYFGSFYNNDSNLGLDKILAPIYHVILTGLLSYYVVVAYFKLIKETYDPENMSVEVLDL